MKQLPSKLLYTVTIIVLTSVVYFFVNSLYKPKVDSVSTNSNSLVNDKVTTNNNSFTGKYINKEFGVEMDVPSRLILRETPTWQLVYDSSFLGNPEPNIAVSILADSANDNGDGSKSPYFNYFITLYNKTIEPKTLLGNHSFFNDIPGKPLKVFGTGITKVGNSNFQKYDFYSATMNGVHLYELAGNLDNGWTVYAWEQRTGNLDVKVNDDDSNLLFLKQMIESLKFY